MKKSFQWIWVLILWLATCIGFTAQPEKQEPASEPATTIRAGLRSSPYGPRNGFPTHSYWLAAARSMAFNFKHAVPTLIWIVGTMETVNINTITKTFSGRVQLSFPAPGGVAFPNIIFAGQDANEAYLKQFDENGFQVWLQVEPANADVSTLIDLVLNRYGKHPCVIGFGIDVEWHRWSRQNNKGMAVGNASALAWSERVRIHNPEYKLFLKHWQKSKMPPNFRQNLVFINDGQQFVSFKHMQNDFKKWGRTFFPAPVGFQFGYAADGKWWRQLADPPGTIGKALLANIPNTSDLIWVDSTMEEIWPPLARR